MNVRKWFKFLERTLQGKQCAIEKLGRGETANIMVNSETFEDPKDEGDKEAIRLKDVPSTPGDSGVEGGMIFY